MPIKLHTEVTVEPIDVMGSDIAVARAAWISTGPDEREKDTNKIEGLLRYLMSHKHGCYDDDTEVLTSTGWKKFPEVDGSETFVTLDPETQEIRHSLADRVVHDQIDGPMIHVQTQQLDLLVTPDHKMLGESRTHAGWGSHLKLFPAREMLERAHRIPLGGGIRQGVDVSSEDARLLGMIIADGNVNHSRITFHLKKSRKINYLASLTTLAATMVPDTYLVTTSDLVRRLAPETYTTDKDRCIPREVLSTWSGESIAYLLEGFLQGDGSVSNTGKVSMSTVSRQLADDLQEAALLSGSAFQERAPDLTRRGAYGTCPLYRLTTIRRRNSTPLVGWTATNRAREVQVVEYHGGIHCVTVPEGTLYVRRNGKSSWCGNTPFEHATLTVRVHAPIMVFREWHRHRVQSYNEQSGRYTQFTPDFYIPGQGRPLVNVGTSARPAMGPADSLTSELTFMEISKSYESSWEAYQRLLALGVANEVARLVLPVGIYSSMYATANVRAWLHFLGLRTSEENAVFQGHPQWEIVQAAKQVESILGQHFPVTMKLFNELGRVAP